ncbi:MAG: hypothetical protein RLY78_1116 [Pseudomonadota bacterium]|uniref:PhnD/SsuA/transferrin family substrate-binding protein n=1 Tax=Pseudaquabacterium rugosum TaxID=2984194 RepID=A0ABU9BB65_9BURK
MSVPLLTVSPDFPNDHIAGWFVFNTWLQKRLGQRVHLELYPDFQSQREAIGRGEIDLIYCNPFDAAALVREHGFQAVAAPLATPDEAVVAVAAASAVQCVEDLQPGTRVAMTADPDVNMVGKIMLEPADLDVANTVPVPCASYVLVAKRLMRGEADVGFFLKDAFEALSPVIRKELRPLVISEISVIRHVFLVGPRCREMAEPLLQALLSMNVPDSADHRVLEGLALRGWEATQAEDTEFMIDLMDTLLD